jgi:hypothetical protein
MTEETTHPESILNYLAHILRRLTDSSASDPNGDDLKRLNGLHFDVAMRILSEGRDKDKRKKRMQAELIANKLDFVLPSLIDLADPQADLSALELPSYGWQWFSLGEIRKEKIPPIEWIVKYFLPKPSVVVFFGKPKTKKSMVALDLCYHVATGTPWMISGPDTSDGIEVKQARVAWVDLENGPRTLKKRILAFDKALGVSAPENGFMAVSMPKPWPDLSKPENVTLLVEFIRALGPVDVIVADHLAQLFGEIDENTSLASQIMNAIRQISETLNVAVVLLHHAKKGGQRDTGSPDDLLRGSGSILAGVDGAFLVEIEPDNKDRKNQITIKPVAVRGPDAPNISATFAYEQEPSTLDLTSARFWKIDYQSKDERANKAVIQAIRESSNLNNTELRAAAKRIDKGLSDASIREAIANLEGVGEIVYTKASKGAKVYKLGGMHEDEDDQG